MATRADEFRWQWRDAMRANRDPRLTARARHLALAMLGYANGDPAPVVWPSVATLAAEMAVSDRTVNNARAVLVELGWLQLVTKGAPRRNSRYALTMPPGVTVPTPEAEAVTVDTPEAVTVDTAVTDAAPINYDDWPDFLRPGYQPEPEPEPAPVVTRGFSNQDELDAYANAAPYVPPTKPGRMQRPTVIIPPSPVPATD